MGFNSFMDIAMCKQSYAGTYLKVNALPVDAQPCFFPFTITVGHFLCGDMVVFFIDPRSGRR